MQRKTILFIPSSYYLSDEAFVKIAQNPEYKSIYLDPKDSVFRSVNLKHRLENFESLFDEYIELPKDLYSGPNILFKFISFQIKKLQIINAIWKLKPSLIVTTTDGTFSSRVVATFFPKIPFVVLQTALITVHSDKYKLIKRSLLMGFFVRCFGDILFPYFAPLKPFGLNHPYATVLLWGESSRKLLLPHVNHQTLHLVGNVLFEDDATENLPKNKVLFLAPHTATDLLALDFCREVLEVVTQFPEILFRIRIHPIMRSSLFYDFFESEKIKNVQIVSNLESLKESIITSNVVISQYSAATLDVIALRRHVILYKKVEEERLSHWFSEMSIPKADTTQGIAALLRQFQILGFLEKANLSEIPITQHWHKVGDLSYKSLMAEISLLMKECTNRAN